MWSSQEMSRAVMGSPRSMDVSTRDYSSPGSRAVYDREAMRIHLITAESPASRRLRRGRLIQFPQLTMPLIAALTPGEHHVWHTDEIVESVRFDAQAD